MVRWKRRSYHKGEFLPDNFSAKDRFRTLYPSRIEEVVLPDPVAEPIVASTIKAATAKSEGTKIAAKLIAKKTTTTGTKSLSGKTPSKNPD